MASTLLVSLLKGLWPQMQYEFIRRSTHNFTGINDHKMVTPDNKVHVANMEPSWVLSAPGGPHVGRMNLAIRDVLNIRYKQRVLMHRHQGWNVRHGLCHIYMKYIYIWVVYSFCLFCCLFIIVTWWYIWCIVWQVASKRKYRHVW